MHRFIVEGGIPLHGSVRIAGAKNAALPILAATLLAPGEHRFANLPDLVDIESMLSLLGRIGCPSLKSEPTRLDTTRIVFNEAPYDLVRKMRASVLVLGPLLARCGEAHVSLPGGCAIGVRPIDQHLKGLEALGCSFTLARGYVHGRTDGLRGGLVDLDIPTVTGTENILMAAVLAHGETEILNAAREPEVVDLVRFLRTLGARIEGEGTPTLHVEGVPSLCPPPEPYTIMPDRIEAGTWLVAGAITGGDVTCRDVRPEDMSAILDALEDTGCTVEVSESTIRAFRKGAIQPIEIRTAPYPGFPTDMQAQFMALLSLGAGTSHIEETIFENRFMHVGEMLRLGANVEIDGNLALVHGVEHLTGASVMATDLRASAGLVLAAVAARGQSEILRIYHLDRGYEDLDGKLRALGARVARLDAEGRETRLPWAANAT